MGVPLLSCEMDVCAGGGYRVAFGQDATEPMIFFGRYIDVVPNARLVWTNEESEDAAMTTVTFEDKGEGTLLVLYELYPSKKALDGAIAGMAEVMAEQFDQLDALLAALDQNV
jgi:uncharacterized protein YndB with AHSA1/START domain